MFSTNVYELWMKIKKKKMVQNFFYFFKITPKSYNTKLGK